MPTHGWIATLSWPGRLGHISEWHTCEFPLISALTAWQKLYFTNHMQLAQSAVMYNSSLAINLSQTPVLIFPDWDWTLVILTHWAQLLLDQTTNLPLLTKVKKYYQQMQLSMVEKLHNSSRYDKQSMTGNQPLRKDKNKHKYSKQGVKKASHLIASADVVKVWG